MKTKTKIAERVIITKSMIGLCGMQVCAIADATDEEILKFCNQQNPSGTAGGWGLVVRKQEEGSLFQIKENLPVTCSEFPERKHFMVLC
jgi:hypothetical protein